MSITCNRKCYIHNLQMTVTTDVGEIQTSLQWRCECEGTLHMCQRRIGSRLSMYRSDKETDWRRLHRDGTPLD